LNRELLALRQCGTQQQADQCDMDKQTFFHVSNPQDHHFGSFYEGCGSLSRL
jgi:hypothetical protein